MQQDRHVESIDLLDPAMIPGNGETAVGDFVVKLFGVLVYAHRRRLARTRVDFLLLICGGSRDAKTNVCIAYHPQNDILLLVQEDKRLEQVESVNARARLVADAVPAFGVNDINRESTELLPLEEKASGFIDPFLN